MNKVNPQTGEALNLLLQGSLALCRAEQAGIRVDEAAAEKQKIYLTKKINQIEATFKETEFYKEWKRSVGGKAINIDSHAQLSKFLYGVKKLTAKTTTTKGKDSTNEDSLLQLGIPELKDLVEKWKLMKVRDTYLEAFIREAVDGYMHPSFGLHLVKSFRSCIAKGTLVLAMRDFIKYPKGVPIEEIKAGDYVYCFSNKLKPTIQKVVWAGKTGHREVVRLHYSVTGGGKGYVDVTPEHLVRLIDGTYREAQYLVGDFRSNTDSKHAQKIRTLSCKRSDDKLNFTGHLKGGKGIHEHRLIYDKLIEHITKEDVIHHINGNHLDHRPKNLRKMNKYTHGYLHGITASPEEQARRIKCLKDNRWRVRIKSGAENPLSMNLSKFTCYRLLSEAGGHPTRINYDFDTFKKYAEINHIDIVQIAMRYDKHGNYIWKSKLQKLSKIGRSEVSKVLGHNYYRLLALYKLYDIDPTRKWGNQFGEFKPGNHVITSVEWIGEKVDVYDIETEKYHNFFANEICVHNSSNSPNFQNIPARDEEAANICRGVLFPHEGHMLMESDFKSVEVGINSCINKDPTLTKYVSDPSTDMHRDMAMQIFKLDSFDKKQDSHSTLRQAAKGAFVFAEFYGDYWSNVTNNLVSNWCKLPKGKWREGQGIAMPEGTISDHLISKGIKSYAAFEKHIQNVEQDFWGNRFKEYAKWKDKFWKSYQKKGYIDLPTGFRCSGLMDKKQVCNYPGQGSAFHVLLRSFILMDELITKERLNSRLIGQIHDSMVLSVDPDEKDHIIKSIKRITTEQVPSEWPWIIVPLSVELKVGKVDGPWSDMSKI